MVLPLLGALAGAGGSIGAALIGADAQSEATQYNWALNMKNFQLRERERRDAQRQADILRSEQKLGGTDALGNRTYFKEGEGWVTDLDPKQQELYDYFYQQELPERQRQFERSASRSRQDADMAGSLLEQFKRVYKENPAEVEALLYEVGTRGLGEGARETLETAMRQAARTGNSNVGRIIADLGKANMEQRGNARLQAKLQAKDYTDQKYNSERGGLANLYQVFAQRAGNPLGASYDPSNIPTEANGLMRFFTQNAQQGNGQAFQSAGMKGGTYDYIEPDLAYANAAGAIGASLSGLGERAGAYFDKRSNNNLMRSYMSAGGQFDMAGGGQYGKVADRLNVNGGLY